MPTFLGTNSTRLQLTPPPLSSPLPPFAPVSEAEDLELDAERCGWRAEFLRAKARGCAWGASTEGAARARARAHARAVRGSWLVEAETKGSLIIM